MGEQEKTATDTPATGEKKDESNEQVAQSYSIYPVQIQSFQEDEVKLINSYMGIALIHGNQIESINALNPGENLEYKITNTIQKMNSKISALLRLKEDIKVKLFLSSHLTQLKELGEGAEKIVTDLNTSHYGKLKFELLDPDSNQELTTEADKLNAFAVQLQGQNGQPLPYKSYAGLVVAYGESSFQIPMLNRMPIFGGYQPVEMEQLKKSIEGITSKLIGAFQELGYVTDNSTLALYGNPNQMSPTGQPDEGLTNFNQHISESYTVSGLSLKDGIPSGMKTLILAGPKSTFSDWDLFQIDQFLMQGNSVALFLDGFVEERNQGYTGSPYGPQPSYVPVNSGLEKLIKHYGVNLKSSYIMDENCYIARQQTRTGGYQETPIFYAPRILDKYISDELPFIKNVKELIFVKVSPLELIQDNIKENVKAHLLVSSSDKAWEVSENINLYDPTVTPPAGVEKKSKPLAYLLEGQMVSFFKDKPLPTKPAEENNETAPADQSRTSVIKETEVAKAENFIPQSKGGKLFVMGASTILENMALGASPEDPNALFLLNVIDHLNDRGDFALMRSKGQPSNPLKETDKITKEVVKNVNVFGLPLLALIAGLIFWFTWENRKKQIQSLFAKEQK
jgi:hypothetical protein